MEEKEELYLINLEEFLIKSMDKECILEFLLFKIQKYIKLDEEQKLYILKQEQKICKMHQYH